MGDIDLPTWQQHPTSAGEQPSRDFDLPPLQQPLTCAPNTPNPWLVSTTTTLKEDKMAAAKVIARETTSLAITKDEVNKILGEYINLSFYSPAPEQSVLDAIQELPNHNDWPDNLISLIKNVMGTPCDMPSAPKFSFELSNKAAMHNLKLLRKYQFDLSKALEANNDSPLGPGKKFKPPSVLHKIFSLHPLWS